MGERLEGDGRVSSQIDKEGESLSPQMQLGKLTLEYIDRVIEEGPNSEAAGTYITAVQAIPEYANTCAIQFINWWVYTRKAVDQPIIISFEELHAAMETYLATIPREGESDTR